MGLGKDDPHLRSDLREQGEQLPVIAFDFAFVKTTSADGETRQKYATTLVAVDADLFFVKAICHCTDKIHRRIPSQTRSVEVRWRASNGGPRKQSQTHGGRPCET